jgi:prepilin-type processing-associated H-X9-DG protein
MSNYMGNAGNRDPVGQTGPNNQRPRDGFGLFHFNSEYTFADILDGTSNTVLAGERETRYCRSGAWCGVRNAEGTGSRGVYYVLGWTGARLNQPAGNGWPGRHAGGGYPDVGCGEGFSSLHPGGANFVMADGKVKFLSQDIDFHHSHSGPQMGTYQRLHRRNDAQATEEY